MSVTFTGFTDRKTLPKYRAAVHELTHLVLGTEDHVYGLKSCTELIPAEKITNADNYQVYVEFFQYKSGTFPDLEDATNLHQPPRRT